MLSLLLYGVLAIVLIAVVFVLITRVLPAGEQIAPPVRDEPLWTLPTDQPFVADDIETVRLPVAVRGYRFAETDQLLDRLAEELRERDEQIARLQARAPTPAGDFAPPARPAVAPGVPLAAVPVAGVAGEPAGWDTAPGRHTAEASAAVEPYLEADDGHDG